MRVCCLTYLLTRHSLSTSSLLKTTTFTVANCAITSVKEWLHRYKMKPAIISDLTAKFQMNLGLSFLLQYSSSTYTTTEPTWISSSGFLQAQRPFQYSTNSVRTLKEQMQNETQDTCMTSSAPSSTQRPFSGLYTCVPLIMTVCAGRLTPQASVDVDTKTWMCRSANKSSTSVRSTLHNNHITQHRHRTAINTSVLAVVYQLYRS